ncbi:MAG: hypothetical protein ABR583_13210 [Gaiellaceae bacterium]
MFDQQTKQEFQQNWDQIKPQITQAFPQVSVQDIEQYRSDPDQLVTTIGQKTGQPPEQIEQRLKQFVS